MDIGVLPADPPLPFDLDGFVAAHERKDQLRLITCGSVDDGKSTLLGRLLWETATLADDQVAAVTAASRRHGTQGDAIDLALLVDGLAAEREQGITIDVAYRFFTTDKRRFIVADTPGHEQYTRNMATGASTADLAVLLIDARLGVTPQTRRHALIASMLRVRHVVAVINKMDLAGWSQARADAVGAEARALCDGLGFDSLLVIPLSALSGENVVRRGPSCGWYAGPTLLEHLETVPVPRSEPSALRMAVQRVNRPDPSFRGLSGEVSGGMVQVGDPVIVLPARQAARVERILGPDGDTALAEAGDAVTIVLDRPVDVSRGDVLASPDSPAKVGQTLAARLLWSSEAPGAVGDRFLLKLGARTVTARLARLDGCVSLDTRLAEPADSLRQNDVGDAVLSLERPIAYDLYADSRAMGGFVLIDPESFDTVALGLVQASAVVAPPASDTQVRSLVKAVSYRALGSLATAVIAWAYIGNIGASAAIGGVDAVGKMVIYFLHERLWARIPFGRVPERKAVNSP